MTRRSNGSIHRSRASFSGQRTKMARRKRVEKDLRTSCIAQYNDDDVEARLSNRTHTRKE